MGLLIVNADDWGADPATTDAILDCLRSAGVSSTSGMVYMADSDRASAIAREEGLPVGLHLNVTQPFTDAATPPRVRDRQARLAQRFAGARSPRWLYDPRLQDDVARCVADQLERFEALYGARPTHLDGHNHAHLALNVLRALPAGAKVRTAHSPPPGRRAPLDALRAARHAALRRRFVCSDRFYALRTLHPRLGGAGLDAALALARDASVELMVHPALADEHALLRSADWARALDGLAVGSYADLR